MWDRYYSAQCIKNNQASALSIDKFVEPDYIEHWEAMKKLKVYRCSIGKDFVFLSISTGQAGARL